MTGEDRKAFMRRFVEVTINQRDVDAVDEFAAEDFNEHAPFPGQTQGREGLKDATRFFLSAFPDLEWRIDEQVCEGDQVVSRVSFTGTHRGDFYGVAGTGKRVSGWGIVIDTVEETPDGPRFTASKALIDTHDIMEQLKTDGSQTP